MFWWWALDWAQDGVLADFDAADLADAMAYTGDPDKLLSALIESEYIIETEAGREINGWHKIGGQVIEGRKKETERKQRQREKRLIKKAAAASVPPDVPTLSHGTSRGSPGTVPPVSPPHKELDIDKELDIKKDLKIDGDADSKAEPEPKPNQDQQQNPNPEQPADISAAPDESEKPGKPGKKGNRTRKKPEYAPDSLYMRMALHFKAQLDSLAKTEGVETLIPRANMQSWADDFRKLVELDRQKDQQQIAAVMEWVVTDRFWRKNVLSAETFREKYPTLLIQMNESKRAPTPNKGSGGGRSGKPVLEIAQDDGTGGSTQEEFEAMMRYANELQARKAAAKGEAQGQ